MKKMERILEHIEPQEVFSYFEDLTRIPRQSGNEKEVSDYLLVFAKQHGLACERDKANNVLIRKPASPGYETHPGLILQAHMDMVCEKKDDVVFDFSKDPIRFSVDGDKIIARDTTLGADDGIGLALCLAVLADPDLQHPPLEFVATTDEEVGMLGIESFDFSKLQGSRVLNLDSDDEGVLIVGCAGGPVVRVELPIRRQAADPAKTYYRLSVQGLLGGHSGEDIHRNRANANKLLARLLLELGSVLSFDLAEVTGGVQYNAIPRYAEAIVGIAPEDEKTLYAEAEQFSRIFLEEYSLSDPGVNVLCETADSPQTTLCEEAKMTVLEYMDLTQTGILRMDVHYPQFVESSVSLGVVRTEAERAVMIVMTRSSRESQYEMMYKKIVRLTELYHGTYSVMSNCPAWEFDVRSEMVSIYKKVYHSLFGKAPSLMILHAGIEVSEFARNMDRPMDMISTGPDVRCLHSPGEYVTISSTQKVWTCLKKFIAAL